jgi:hypothetical protein
MKNRVTILYGGEVREPQLPRKASKHNPVVTLSLSYPLTASSHYFLLFLPSLSFVVINKP